MTVLTAWSVIALPSARSLHAAEPTTVESAQQDLDQLTATLTGTESRPEQREEAARRLVSRQSAPARARLADAMLNGSPAVQLAVAKALADDPQPDRVFIKPLLDAVSNGPHALTEAAARTLANYKDSPDILQQMINIVQGRSAVSDAVRRDVIRSLASFIDKRAAEALISILKSQNETQQVRGYAADALGTLTGIDEFGQDPKRWSEWWDSTSRKSDETFRLELLLSRSTRLDQEHQHSQELAGELSRLLQTEYQTAAPEKRPDILMRILKSQFPEERNCGVRLVQDDIGANKRIPATTREQLRLMIGDSDPEVRKLVALVFASIYDEEALQPLLAQLAQEPKGIVRAALAKALAPIKDLKALPALLAMLNDPYTGAIVEAAIAIEKLGPRLYTEDPNNAATTATALVTAFKGFPATADNEVVREALVSAMAPLRQESLVQPIFVPILREQNGESSEMRSVALKALGELRNPQWASIISSYLPAQDAGVRLAAVTALGKLPNKAEYVETLRLRLDKDTDSSVRDKTWEVIVSALPDLNKAQLNDLADRVKDNQSRRLLVLQELEKQLIAAGQEDELATVRDNIGGTLMSTQPISAENATEAAKYFKLALDYKKTQPQVPQVVIVNLTESLMKALLQSLQYHEAIAFAAAQIKENGANEQSMGTLIKQEAETLVVHGDLANASKLITEAFAMNPPLNQTYQDQLTDIQRRMKQNGLTPKGSDSPPANVSAPAPQSFGTASGR